MTVYAYSETLRLARGDNPFCIAIHSRGAHREMALPPSLLPIALLAVPCYHYWSMEQNWQQQVADFARKHDLLHDPLTHALDLVAEVGEIAKGMLRAGHYGHRPLSPDPEIEGELGDSLYSLLTLAEACGVDAAEALQAALAKYEQRLRHHGDAGSRHEP